MRSNVGKKIVIDSEECVQPPNRGFKENVEGNVMKGFHKMSGRKMRAMLKLSYLVKL